MTYEQQLRQHYIDVKKRLYSAGVMKLPAPARPVINQESWYVRPPAPWVNIILEVSKKHRFTYEQLKSKDKSRKLSAARQEIYYRVHKEGNGTKWALTALEIAELLGRRNNSCVHNGIKRHKERVAKNGQA